MGQSRCAWGRGWGLGARRWGGWGGEGVRAVGGEGVGSYALKGAANT